MELILQEQDKISNASVRLRGGLQRLCSLLENIKEPPEYVDMDVPPWPVQNLAQLLRPKVEDTEEDSEKPPINEDGKYL